MVVVRCAAGSKAACGTMLGVVLLCDRRGGAGSMPLEGRWGSCHHMLANKKKKGLTAEENRVETVGVLSTNREFVSRVPCRACEAARLKCASRDGVCVELVSCCSCCSCYCSRAPLLRWCPCSFFFTLLVFLHVFFFQCSPFTV